MKTDLDLLIESYQFELDNLRKQLDLCLKEHDYEGAYYLNEAINFTSSKLATFEQIKDPDDFRKRSRKNIIKFQKEKLSKEKDPVWKKIQLQTIRALEKELKTLDDKKEQFREDGTFILDSLFELLNGTISILQLKYHNELNLEFSLTGKNNIQLKLVSNENLNQYLRHYKDLQYFLNMSFNLEKDYHTMTYEINKETDLLKILEILSVLFFDFIHFEKGHKLIGLKK